MEEEKKINKAMSSYAIGVADALIEKLKKTSE